MKKARLFTPLLTLTIASLIVGLYISESRHNSGFTIVDALENSLIVLVGEYPDKPASIAERIFMLALLLFGILAFGAIIGKISSIFVTRSLTGKGKMQKSHRYL